MTIRFFLETKSGNESEIKTAFLKVVAGIDCEIASHNGTTSRSVIFDDGTKVDGFKPAKFLTADIDGGKNKDSGQVVVLERLRDTGIVEKHDLNWGMIPL